MNSRTNVGRESLEWIIVPFTELFQKGKKLTTPFRFYTF